MTSWRTRVWTACWWVFTVVTVVVVVLSTWKLFTHLPYQIDVDVYRLGARAWLDGHPLYQDHTVFHTEVGLDLAFTYPPVSAIAFSPLSWLSLHGATVAVTAVILVLLVVSTMLVLSRLDVPPTSNGPTRDVWLRRGVLALAISFAASFLEPFESNFTYGQVNVILMTLVLADCLPRRTPWPRGVLVGLAIALKLTPAVFLLYFALRRDGRAALTAVASFAGATLLGFALAWRDSLEYWTTTVRDTGRIGSVGYRKDQNIAGALARLDLTHTQQFAMWAVAGCALFAVTVWATRRVLHAGEPVLALNCIALFGLVVSPVSWSHHWVWVLPALITTSVLAYRHRNVALAAVTAVGVALLMWAPMDLMPANQEFTATAWRQVLGASYVWWAVAVIVVAGATITAPTLTQPRPTRRLRAAASPVP
jgi:alpha-1,2-mannosyltransferase